MTSPKSNLAREESARMHYSALASGSSGNSSTLEIGKDTILIDCGIGPRVLTQRLRHHDLDWESVHAVLLTHTHSDHWQEATLNQLCKRNIPLYCHPGHIDTLQCESRSAMRLLQNGLLRTFQTGITFSVMAGLECQAFALSHDSGPTVGFRCWGRGDLFGGSTCLAYAADLGCWSDEHVAMLSDVDILALEFNHDVRMQKSSGRHPSLIARVLGDEGHLSNEQAANLLARVLGKSPPGRLRAVVQLHLSRQCNTRELARSAASAVLAEHAHPVALITARHDRPTKRLALSGPPQAAPAGKQAHPSTSGRSRRGNQLHPWLPGLETEQDAACGVIEPHAREAKA